MSNINEWGNCISWDYPYPRPDYWGSYKEAKCVPISRSEIDKLIPNPIHKRSVLQKSILEKVMSYSIGGKCHASSKHTELSGKYAVASFYGYIPRGGSLQKTPYGYLRCKFSRIEDEKLEFKKCQLELNDENFELYKNLCI